MDIERLWAPLAVVIGVIIGVVLFLIGCHRLNPQKAKLKFIRDILIIATTTIFILLSISYSCKYTDQHGKNRSGQEVTQDEMKKLRDLWNALNNAWEQGKQPGFGNFNAVLNEAIEMVDRKRNLSENVEMLLSWFIKKRYQRLRPKTEFRFGRVTCYIPYIPTPEEEEYFIANQDIEKQFKELRKIAQERKVDRQIVEKIKTSILKNLETMLEFEKINVEDEDKNAFVGILLELNVGEKYKSILQDK